MADLVIFGAGALAELAHYYFGRDDSAHRVAAFVVDGEYLREDRFRGLPVVAAEAIPPEFRADRCLAFVAIGYNNVNRLRAEKCAAMRDAGYTLASYVSSRAVVLSDRAPGWNCLILERATIQPRVSLGNGVMMMGGGSIAYGTTIGDNVYIGRLAAVANDVHVGANTFLGVGSVVRDRVRIGRNCVIGAGAVIVRDAEDDSVYVAPRAEKSRVPSFRLRRL